MKRNASILSMLKKLIFPPLIIAAIYFTSQDTKAEGGCPKGSYPDGGSCRKIVCKVAELEFVNYSVRYGESKPSGSGICSYPGGCGGRYGRRTYSEDPRPLAVMKKSGFECHGGYAAFWAN